MTQKPATIFISAAEASGDAHAAKLIRAMRDRLPNARFVGAGGPAMRDAGCELLAETTHLGSHLSRRLRAIVTACGLSARISIPQRSWILVRLLSVLPRGGSRDATEDSCALGRVGGGQRGSEVREGELTIS